MLDFLTAPYARLWAHRRLLGRTTLGDFRARYAGNILGLVWVFLYPLLFLGLYASVYILIFRVRLEHLNSQEYVALVFCGLLPFLAFAEALTFGITSVTSNAALVKNTLYPIELLPVKAVLLSQGTQVVGMGLLVLMCAALGRLTTWALLVPLVWIMQVLFTIGLIWVLACVNVFFRDLQNLVGLITLTLMMISPIAYTVEMIPRALKPLVILNPLAHIILAYQELLLLGRFPAHGELIVVTLLGPITCAGGYWFFGRIKKAFFDAV